MFRWLRLLICVVVVIATTDQCIAQPGGGHGRSDHNHGSYPLVYGATGRPYGPTQANYQYQRRYGRPWHGEGDHGHGHGVGNVNGSPVTVHHHGHFYGGPPYLSPYVYPPYGYASPYAFGIPFQTFPPPVSFHGYIPGVPSFSSSEYYQRQEFRPQLLHPPSPLNLAPDGFNAPDLVPQHSVIPESSPAAQVQSLHFMAQGDLKLREMNYLGAADRYQEAIRVARDLAEPRYRYAVTLAARSKFVDAVLEFKLAFAVNPNWVSDNQSLDELFGENNLLAKTQIKQRIADWLLVDSRDPDRLFLLGLFLHMDGDPRSQILIDTAIKVAGPEPHLLALKRHAPVPANPALPGAPDTDNPHIQPPAKALPEAVPEFADPNPILPEDEPINGPLLAPVQ